MNEQERLDARVRDAARAFVERARRDPEFVTLFRSDPVGAFRLSGMPAIAIGDALRETGHEEREVVGFMSGALATRAQELSTIEPFVLAECGFTCLWTSSGPM